MSAFGLILLSDNSSCIIQNILLPISVLLNIILFFWGNKTKKKLSSATSELTISKDIRDSTTKFAEKSAELDYLLKKRDNGIPNTPDEINKIGTLSIEIPTLVENNLNVYESACSLYITGKIDKTAFKNNYYEDLLRLQRNKITNEMLTREPRSYRNIKKVYKEWTNKNLEKYT